MGLDLLWLLLPVAAASGWLVGRRAVEPREAPPARGRLGSDYYRGINYLLNEQPDKAIEVFIELLEVDSETAQTHIALGNLYRRRGEVDRAIRIHQNLVSRAGDRSGERHDALLELAQDYLSAGLLDRAENLFLELSEISGYEVQALRQLIDIYEQERDWEKAVRSVRQLERVTGNQLGVVIAHYQCEEAQRLRAAGDAGAALAQARAALASHRGSVRASLLEGELLQASGDIDGALDAFRRVETQDPDYIPVAVPRIEECFRLGGRRGELGAVLERLAEAHGGVTVLLARAKVVAEAEGARAAVDMLAAALRSRSSVRGLDRLVELERQLLRGGREPREAAHLEILSTLTRELLRDRPVYQCSHCGFPARSLHWQCPSCKHWNTVKPIRGVDGE
ncbi:MAG: lipopolysaccharide assembly protein LapB [Ectothiorhodospiraceae bacterium]|nr:lipopolysaccharide assembly protein LapB [Chromatiales bacterium]MCP5156896.1 lipopolysaccharide assembly protein LapB [Ectothiorhodospiraceae bacterium]